MKHKLVEFPLFTKDGLVDLAGILENVKATSKMANLMRLTIALEGDKLVVCHELNSNGAIN